MRQPLSKPVLYIFIIVATVLLPVVYKLGMAYIDASLDQHGHGIDGVGAAIFAVLVFKIMAFAAIGIYIIMVAKIVQGCLHYKEVPNILIVIPFIPILLQMAYNGYTTYQSNRVQASYTVEDYVVEVKQNLPRYMHNVDGKQAIYAYDYISSCVAEDSYWLTYRLRFDQGKRKAIIDEAIPVLMKDREKKDLCACKFYDGKDHYFYTEMEYWEYRDDLDLLTVKFTHEDEPCQLTISYN